MEEKENIIRGMEFKKNNKELNAASNPDIKENIADQRNPVISGLLMTSKNEAGIIDKTNNDNIVSEFDTIVSEVSELCNDNAKNTSAANDERNKQRSPGVNNEDIGLQNNSCEDVTNDINNDPTEAQTDNNAKHLNESEAILVYAQELLTNDNKEGTIHFPIDQPIDTQHNHAIYASVNKNMKKNLKTNDSGGNGNQREIGERESFSTLI